MILFKTTRPLQTHLKKLADKGLTIGFVPTMGALHNGHISLINDCRKHCDITACSIFVNPTQFNDKKDFEKYPVTIENDIYLLETNNLRLQVPRKANSKRAREPWLEIHKSLVRKYIETTIGEISKLFPKKIHATNLNGFLLKIALFLFAYQIDKALIQ